MRVVLIGGSSHAGKSMLAAHLAKQPGWTCRSTDMLARHPGRPWKAEPDPVPDHVAQHYRTLSVDELLADVLRHYRGLWSGIEALVTAHAIDPATQSLVLEGSALWPESVAQLRLENVAAIWLTCSDERFRSRIYDESRFETKTNEGKELVEKFLARTLLYNARMMQAVDRLGLPSVNVDSTSSVEELGTRSLEVLTSRPLRPMDNA